MAFAAFDASASSRPWAVHPLRAVAVAVAVALSGGCVASPDEAQTVEGLTVCHSTTVEGVDVSEFQGGSINWGAVHASGREFAIARVGDGTYVDPDFARNWSGIAAAGMIRGAYLFFRPTDSAASQAAAIAAAVGHLGSRDLPVTIDVECMCPVSVAPACNSSHAGCVSAGTAASVLRALVSQVQSDTGKVPMIYTGSWFWDGGSYLADTITLPSNPLWVSGYTTGCVTVPGGWSDWHIWQYTDGTCAGCPSVGSVPGIGQSVDRDRFNGTLADLQAFAGGGTVSGPAYGATFVSQTFPYASVGPLTIRATTTASVSITLRNSGTHAWDSHTCIGTTVPRDHTDPFAGPEWPGPNRPACVSGSVAPGGTHAFTWTIHAPATTGSRDEHWGVVEDGVAWFSDPGQGGPPDNDLEGIFDVTAAPPPPPHDAGFPDTGYADTGIAEPDAVVTVPDGGPMEMDAGSNGSDAAPVETDAAVVTDVGNEAAVASDSGDASADAGTPGNDTPGMGVSPGQSGCGCTMPGRMPRTPALVGVMALAVVVRRRRRTRVG